MLCLPYSALCVMITLLLYSWHCFHKRRNYTVCVCEKGRCHLGLKAGSIAAPTTSTLRHRSRLSLPSQILTLCKNIQLTLDQCLLLVADHGSVYPARIIYLCIRGKKK